MPSDDNSQQTFKERVTEFWLWYEGVAQSFFDTIEEGNCGDLSEETSGICSRLFPGFDWVFGPGPEEIGGHSFTLSGNGNKHLQFLTEHWSSKAPDLPGWTFYPARQPGQFDPETGLVVDGNDFKFGKIWVTPEIDSEQEKIHLAAWHPLFEVVEDKKMMVLFLMLDEALGEYGVGSSLGAIEISKDQLANSFPLSELPEFVKQTEADRGWKRYAPTECYTSYKGNPKETAYLRSDVFAGSTSHFRLVTEYIEAEGNYEDPLENTGAEFVFIALDSKILPKGNEIHFRAEIEDAIEESLRDSGQLIGGASGVDYSYIDLLLFDGDRSLAIVKEVLLEQNLPEGTGIHFFAQGNEGRRIFL